MLVKVNGRPTRSFDGLVNDLFGFNNIANREWNNNNNSVPVNIVETAEGFNLDLSAPGRNKEDFKLKVENNLLTISFEAKEAVKEEGQKENKQIRKEFGVESFKRSFTLDDKVDADGIQAKYEAGLLKLFVPKKEETKPAVKEITIG